MKPISLIMHGAIDYLAVAIFAAAPTVIGLTGWPAALSYILAGVHFLMTILTDFPAGAAGLIAVSIHKWVERIVGPALVIIALVPDERPEARVFFAVMGVVIFAVERLTAYGFSIRAHG